MSAYCRNEMKTKGIFRPELYRRPVPTGELALRTTFTFGAFSCLHLHHQSAHGYSPAHKKSSINFESSCFMWCRRTEKSQFFDSKSSKNYEMNSGLKAHISAVSILSLAFSSHIAVCIHDFRQRKRGLTIGVLYLWITTSLVSGTTPVQETKQRIQRQQKPQ